MNTITIKKEENRAKEQAKSQLESIVEMAGRLNKADQGDDEDERDEARTAIHEDPLSVEVRTDWHTLDAEDQKPTHYRILLACGGPAVQIIGELSEHLEPETAVLQYQDWGTPWTEYHGTTNSEDKALLDYAQTFYFGE